MKMIVKLSKKLMTDEELLTANVRPESLAKKIDAKIKEKEELCTPY